MESNEREPSETEKRGRRGAAWLLSWHEHDRKSAYATLRSNWVERVDTEEEEEEEEEEGNEEEVRGPKVSSFSALVFS